MKKLRKIILTLFVIGCVCALIGLLINARVKAVGGSLIVSPEEAYQTEGADCIIVLGCFVKNDGVPSDILTDRLERGIDLYFNGAAPKIIMSGDHGTVEYDEVNAMKQYAIDKGVPSEDIFMDHAGFSTYETVYRAKEVFDAHKVIIVTQEYHLSRALYIAKRLGLEATGVSSDYNTYAGATYRECREILARCKDFFMTIIKPKPTYLGEVIPVSGNGDATNDR